MRQWASDSLLQNGLIDLFSTPPCPFNLSIFQTRELQIICSLFGICFMPDGSIGSYVCCGCALVICGFAYWERISRNIQEIILILSWTSLEWTGLAQHVWRMGEWMYWRNEKWTMKKTSLFVWMQVCNEGMSLVPVKDSGGECPEQSCE